MGHEAGLRASEHFGQTICELLKGPYGTLTENYFRICTGENHPFANSVVVLRAGDEISTQQAIGTDCENKLPPLVFYCSEPSPNAMEVLRANGFDGPSLRPVMGVELDRIETPILPVGYRFEQVLNKQGSEEWVRAAMEGFELTPLLTEAFSYHYCGGTTADDALAKWFVIRKGDAVVATSMLHCHRGLAGIYCVSTVPSERGKGLGAFITAHSALASGRLGYKVSILQASDMGLPVYKRTGYQVLGEMGTYHRKPPQA